MTFGGLNALFGVGFSPACYVFNRNSLEGVLAQLGIVSFGLSPGGDGGGRHHLGSADVDEGCRSGMFVIRDCGYRRRSWRR